MPEKIHRSTDLFSLGAARKIAHPHFLEDVDPGLERYGRGVLRRLRLVQAAQVAGVGIVVLTGLTVFFEAPLENVSLV